MDQVKTISEFRMKHNVMLAFKQVLFEEKIKKRRLQYGFDCLVFGVKQQAEEENQKISYLRRAPLLSVYYKHWRHVLKSKQANTFIRSKQLNSMYAVYQVLI